MPDLSPSRAGGVPPESADSVTPPGTALLDASWRGLATLGLVVLLAWLPGALAPALGSAADWLLTLALAVVAGVLARGRPGILLLALLPATLLAATGLVADAGRYQPMVVVSLPLVAIYGVRLLRRDVPVPRLDPALAATLAAYVLWCAVTTVTSTARATSAVYLAGIALTLALVYGTAPRLVDGQTARRAVLGVVATLGAACVAIGLLALSGPWTLFGRQVGLYEIIELVVAGTPTGVILPRIMGPFLATNGQGINVALALIAVAALAAVSSGRRRGLLTAVAVVLLAALLVSFSRNGWLLAIIGLGTLAAPAVLRRRWSLSASLAAVTALVFVLLFASVLTAVRRPDLMTARYGSGGGSVSTDLSAPPPAATPSPSIVPASPSPAGDVEPVILARAVAPPDAAGRAGQAASPSDSPQVTPAPSPPASAPPVREPDRGGSGLTGREELWRASVSAIRERPVVGWGLGQVIVAIAPFVPPNLGLDGLTSHSTWFRAAVETGIPGLATLIAWVLVSLALILRRFRSDPSSRTDPIRLAFVGSFLGLTAAATFDTFLLGGVTFMNVYWALSALLAAGAIARSGRDASLSGPPSA